MKDYPHLLDKYFEGTINESHLVPLDTKLDKKLTCYASYGSLLAFQVRNHIERQINEYLHTYSILDISKIDRDIMDKLLDEIQPFVRICEKPFVNKGNIRIPYHIDYQGESQMVKTIVHNMNRLDHLDPECPINTNISKKPLW